MGWTDIDEYVSANGVPEVWPENGLFSMLIAKDSGNFVYWCAHPAVVALFVHSCKLLL